MTDPLETLKTSIKTLAEVKKYATLRYILSTMNAADILYGITMQEKGVSTLVSVDLIETLAT